MVNPYEAPAGPVDPSELRVAKESIRFAGGWPAVLTVGALAGVLAMLVPVIANRLGHDFGILGLVILGAPFFALNYALLRMIRGVPMTSRMCFWGACLMSPASMIVFVPVCFGGVFTMSMSGSLLRNAAPDRMEQLGIFVGLGVVLIGFAVIATIMAVLIRSWVASKHNKASHAVPGNVFVVDLDGNSKPDDA